MSPSSPPIEESCFWMARRPGRPPAEPLRGHAAADIAIIGGGLHGSLDGPLPEGAGASPKSRGSRAGAGGLRGKRPQCRHRRRDDRPLARARDRALRPGGSEAAGPARAGEPRRDGDVSPRARHRCRIRAHGPACGGGPTRSTSVRSRRVGRRPSAWARRAGVCCPGTRRGPSSHSPLYEGALLSPRSALVDPVRLSEGLRGAAVRAGVQVHERTPVRKITFRRDRVEVWAEGGTVRAEKLVLATNAYTHHLRPSLAARFLPLYDYVLVSDPLTPAQREAIGWRSRRASSTPGRSSTTTG